MKIQSTPRLHSDWLDPDATQIVRQLQNAGFETYFVGGCVRDLLAGIPPKDFDVATVARPNQVKRIIHQAYVIGKRFRLVLVKRGDSQFEVATFRRAPSAEELQSPEEVPWGDNLFGTPEEDARRRDFTFNSLFYDPVKDLIIDYCGGQSDIEDRLLKTIGDPHDRLPEDPIRILRALRLAHKLNFTLDPTLRAKMSEHAYTLPKTVLPRRREEMLKILKLKDPVAALQEAFDLGILQNCYPSLVPVFENEENLFIFSEYFKRRNFLVQHKTPPESHFGVLAIAFTRALVQRDIKFLSANEFLNNPLVAKLFKDELGLFNIEQKTIALALQLQTDLKKLEEFKRRGPRRIGGFFKNEGIDMALNLAYMDLSLPAQDIEEWIRLKETGGKVAPAPSNINEAEPQSH